MKYKTKVINMVAAAGAGKTTTALLLAGQMKRMGLSADYVREFVKNWAYEGRRVRAHEQGIIFENQSENERPMYGNVEYVISDSPLCLSEIYEEHYFNSTTTKGLYDEWVKKHPNVTPIFFEINRTKEYVREGRYETEEQARALDKLISDKVKVIANRLGFEYYNVNYDTATEEVVTISGLKK